MDNNKNMNINHNNNNIKTELPACERSRMIPTWSMMERVPGKFSIVCRLHQADHHLSPKNW